MQSLLERPSKLMMGVHSPHPLNETPELPSCEGTTLVSASQAGFERQDPNAVA